jgi:predicted regulator of Ras-like GTPase activity (Roadblock/LC7/MglB family)
MMAERGNAEYSPKEAAESLFAPLLGDADRAALLLDRDGVVLAGLFVDQSGADVGEEVAAVLAGVAEEIQTAMVHLGLGEWRGCVVEAQHATLGLAPCKRTSVLLVAAARDSTVGSVRRFLEHARRRAERWLEGAQ